MGEEGYLEYKKFKRKTSKTGMALSKFGKGLKTASKATGRGLKTSYKAATSEKAKAKYKKFGNAAKKGTKATLKGVDKLSNWDGGLFGTTKKQKKTTKRRKSRKPRKVVTQYY